MDISKIDKNLKVESSIKKDGLVWFDASESPFKIYGAYSTNPYMRIPDEVAKNTNDGVSGLNFHTAGIRVRFRTDSPFIAIKAVYHGISLFSHMPLTGTSGFDLYRYHEGAQQYVATFIPPADSRNGYESVVDVCCGMSDYIINFPLYNHVDKLYIGLYAEAKFEASAEYKFQNPIVFYGSSITQGGCASRPGNCYQNLLSQKLDFDYINLGFSGSARAEDAIAEYMAGLNMSMFISDYDHNAPNVEHLEKTHYKLYETIRKKHSDIPYIMISKPNINFIPFSDASPRVADSERRKVIMESYVKAMNNGDNNVYFVDGASIFSYDNFDSCTVDRTHPNDLGFYEFQKALYPIFKKLLHNDFK